ncbi:MAG: hypothetical protein GY679_00430 [Mycoplasma sp.]|nr:hypothetical protein [Mycoplasma sp.]
MFKIITIKFPFLAFSSLLIFVAGILFLFLFAIYIMKKIWIKDFLLLKEMGMKCNSSQDIQFASNSIFKNFFISINIKGSLFLCISNIIINIFYIYFNNNKTLSGYTEYIISISVYCLVIWLIQCTTVFYIKKKYTNPIKTNKLNFFLKTYKANIKNSNLNYNNLPLEIKHLIKKINSNKDIKNQAILITSKYNCFYNKKNNIKKSVELFEYIIINK